MTIRGGRELKMWSNQLQPKHIAKHHKHAYYLGGRILLKRLLLNKHEAALFLNNAPLHRIVFCKVPANNKLQNKKCKRAHAKVLLLRHENHFHRIVTSLTRWKNEKRSVKSRNYKRNSSKRSEKNNKSENLRKNRKHENNICVRYWQRLTNSKSCGVSVLHFAIYTLNSYNA